MGHYLNLYKADNRIRVLRENLALTEQVLETMRARREQGTVLQNDITRYELRREQLRLELQRAEDTGTILNHRLVTALHLPEGTEIRPDTTLLQTGIGTLSQSDWQDVARENNLDLRSAQTGIGMSDEAVRLQRSERLPKVSLMAADENYAVVSNRYANDLALLTDMLDAGNTKLEADLALVEARINLIYDYYRMKYVTHTL